MLQHELKEDLINGLVNIFESNILMIVLYGSVARNEATSESDIDIAIILRNEMTEEIRNNFIKLASDLDIKYDKILSIIDIQLSNMEKWGKILPFYKNIQEEGIVLWKAA